MVGAVLLLLLVDHRGRCSNRNCTPSFGARAAGAARPGSCFGHRGRVGNDCPRVCIFRQSGYRQTIAAGRGRTLRSAPLVPENRWEGLLASRCVVHHRSVALDTFWRIRNCTNMSGGSGATPWALFCTKERLEKGSEMFPDSVWIAMLSASLSDSTVMRLQTLMCSHPTPPPPHPLHPPRILCSRRRSRAPHSSPVCLAEAIRECCGTPLCCKTWSSRGRGSGSPADGARIFASASVKKGKWLDPNLSSS